MSKASDLPTSVLKSRRTRAARIFAWTLAMAVCLTAIIVWGRDYGWHLLPFSAYTSFPLLGLLAFSLMWTHYIVAAVRDLVGLDKIALANYFRLTGYAVLILI